MSRLDEVLGGHAGNYIFPFFWQQGDHTERIPELISEIYDSGIRAITVESRIHREFCGDGWWRDMDIILAEAEKRGMKVWILDDYQYPTGVANWAIRDKYPALRPWRLVERHVDVAGPGRALSVVCDADDADNELLGVYAYRRVEGEGGYEYGAEGEGESITGEGIDLTASVSDGFVWFDLPQGVWRIFMYYKTRRGTDRGLEYYVDMINRDSVAALVEAVYQPHYEHYEKYFGNVIEGFFSDEPELANEFAAPHTRDCGMYRRTVGMPGLALPWSDELHGRMTDALGSDPLPLLAALWYKHDSDWPLLRRAYMDAVTTLWRDNFTAQLGDWCRKRGVLHIGHIIEDMNAHARLGSSAGHYFRALEGQDMSGIDIVMQQVMPGLSGFAHATAAWGGTADPVFFQYVLPKLASSLAHLTPHMRGRAMCEVFGAYGWAEDTPTMKWLADFLLVRGVNRFVPHAFNPAFPGDDAPPYFGAGGHDPQYAAFGVLMRYINKVAHLLEGARHSAPAAVLYHAEGEWMSGTLGSAMLTQTPARALYDDHIDFDIVSADMLASATVADGRMLLGGEEFRALVLPSARHLPPELLLCVANLADSGLPVWFVHDDRTPPFPEECPSDCFESVDVGDLASALRGRGLADISLDGDFPLLRVYHAHRSDGEEYYMLSNESLTVTADTTLTLPSHGEGVLLDLLSGTQKRAALPDGKLKIVLRPYESRILVLGASARALAKTVPEVVSNRACSIDMPPRELTPMWRISVAPHEALADGGDLVKFEHYRDSEHLVNISSPREIPDFGGLVRYEAEFTLEQSEDDGTLTLDLGTVGSSAAVTINGVYCGMRICPPYEFAVGDAVRDGSNSLLIEVAGNIAHSIPDHFSRFSAIAPTGMLGPVTIRG